MKYADAAYGSDTLSGGSDTDGDARNTKANGYMGADEARIWM